MKGMASSSPPWPGDVTSPQGTPGPVDSLWRPPPGSPDAFCLPFTNRGQQARLGRSSGRRRPPAAERWHAYRGHVPGLYG